MKTKYEIKSYAVINRKTQLLLLSFMWCAVGYAEISQEDGTLAVLGEAGPSYEERLAIAHAIQNRGTLHGVYGYRNAISKRFKAPDWQNASRAWNEALESTPGQDLTHKATHWLSDYDLKHCKASLTAFRFRMVETAYISHTHFYKEV